MRFCYNLHANCWVLFPLLVGHSIVGSGSFVGPSRLVHLQKNSFARALNFLLECFLRDSGIRGCGSSPFHCCFPFSFHCLVLRFRFGYLEFNLGSPSNLEYLVIHPFDHHLKNFSFSRPFGCLASNDWVDCSHPFSHPFGRVGLPWGHCSHHHPLVLLAFDCSCPSSYACTHLHCFSHYIN